MGKLYLDAGNKLVVETDNGRINPNGSTNVEINSDETYTMNVEDIAMLLKIVNNQDTKHVSMFKDGYGMFYSCKIISSEDMKKEFEKKDKIMRELKSTNNDLYEENKKLKGKIYDFNHDKKIFWRPIKIGD